MVVMAFLTCRSGSVLIGDPAVRVSLSGFLLRGIVLVRVFSSLF